jgi:hypothetical protein
MLLQGVVQGCNRTNLHNPKRTLKKKPFLLFDSTGTLEREKNSRCARFANVYKLAFKSDICPWHVTSICIF